MDDRIIGYAPENTDMDDIVRQARQELTQKTGERISGEVVWSSEECRKPFQKLLSENELKEAVENILSEKNAEEKQRVYTVAIDEYRANFATMDEVESFLEKVKASRMRRMNTGRSLRIRAPCERNFDSVSCQKGRRGCSG